MAGAATPALAALIKAGVPHEILQFEIISDLSESGDIVPDQVFKTLIIALPHELAVAIVSNWFLLYGNLGAPMLGVTGVGVSWSLASWTQLVILVIYVRRETLLASADVLHAGTSIWIAPEGTRSKSGELGEFRKGGFHLALQSGCRILPITIIGTGAVLPAKGAHITDGCQVRVVIHPAIDPKAYGEARRDELIAAVRGLIASALTPNA